MITGILSDQCHWLDELNDRDGFFSSFDFVFNSFHTGRTKKDSGTFAFVLEKIGSKHSQTVFVDDHQAHVERARLQGLNTIFYKNRREFFQSLREFFPKQTLHQLKNLNGTILPLIKLIELSRIKDLFYT